MTERAVSCEGPRAVARIPGERSAFRRVPSVTPLLNRGQVLWVYASSCEEFGALGRDSYNCGLVGCREPVPQRIADERTKVTLRRDHIWAIKDQYLHRVRQCDLVSTCPAV